MYCKNCGKEHDGLFGIRMNIKYLLQRDFLMENEKNTIRFSPSKLPYIVNSLHELDYFTYEDDILVPIGSVEFTKKFADAQNIQLSDSDTYPNSLQKYIHRNIRQGVFKKALDTEFVKPVLTKVFNGNIKSLVEEDVNPDTEVWISEPVKFNYEFRVYVNNRSIVGWAQYDDNELDYAPNLEYTPTMVEAYVDQPVGYSIDVGYIDNKEELIEVNDGWSLGFYQWGTLKPEGYVKLITDRWLEIVGE